MGRNDDDGRRGRIARLLIAAVLAVVAIRSLRNGKRVSGALAAVGAIVVGRDAATEFDDLTERDEKLIDVGGDPDAADSAAVAGRPGDDAGGSVGGAGQSDDGATLRCAICGEPIVPGQARGPGPNDEIVHDACEEALA